MAMLTYDLSKRQDLPIYEYLYRCIREDIVAGRLSAGEKLPSKRELARHLQVGVITVSSAYDQLLQEGYIISRERVGHFVAALDAVRVSTDALWFQQDRIDASDLVEPEPHELEFFMDFKANHIATQRFPASIWSRYMREALSLTDGSLLKTIPYKGLYELRHAIARYLKANRGMKVRSAQIVIGAGTEYLYGRLLQLFGRECIIATEEPGYQKIRSIVSANGMRWVPVPIDKQGLCVDALELSDADVVHVSPANHFPTGIIMSAQRRFELYDWACRIHKRYIIEDDYDSEFRYSGTYIPPLAAEDAQDKVIYMNTFSKTLVPSLRISYMVLPPALMRRYEETMSFYACSVSSFEQYALARFISEGHLERHINRMKSQFKKVRARLLAEIAASPLADVSEVIENNAGTHFLLRVRTDMTEEELRAAAAVEDIALSFYSEYRAAEDISGWQTLVISYAYMDFDRIPEVVERLCRCIA